MASGRVGCLSKGQYLPSLLSICPDHWSDRREHEMAEMILAVPRGFLVESRTSGDTAGVAAGFEALVHGRGDG